eukprot:TRINITY_DN7158_c0_g1_i1.p1 TRINITY_DN7158_c0_g1~~TRINITY_DN7158_c0_g1_i1.p1  ORF type:complete len:152 (-),score=36.07 TRINITY_DN7158_c0_g1_i1:576-1031(-)
MLNTNETVDQIKIKEKKEIVACLKCRQNHKKCDGQRPCYFCKRKGFECCDNLKRKSVGRPKKEMDTNKTKSKKIKKIILKCIKCNTPYDEKKAQFCYKCGFKVSDKTGLENNNNNLLENENRMLKENNEELKYLLQLRMFASNQMWFIMKL